MGKMAVERIQNKNPYQGLFNEFAELLNVSVLTL